MRMLFLSIILLLPMASGCTAQEARDTLFRTVENAARGACETAENCRNQCFDGRTAHGPGYRCP